MDATQRATRVIEGPALIHAAGARPLVRRRLGARWRQALAVGALSGLMLFQALAPATAATPDTPRAPLAAPLPAAPLPAAQWFSPVEHLPAAQDLVAANGTIDAAAMIDRWHAAGISTPAIHQLAQLMVTTQSPLLTRDPAHLAQARYLSGFTAGMFELTDNDQATAFLLERGLPALVERGELPASTLNATLRVFADPSQARLSDVRDYWLHGSVLTADGASAPLRADPSAPDMAAARQRLVRAMDQAGLASVCLPLPMWTHSDRVLQAAASIEQANRELSTITGWEGPVLGLAGRLDLTLGNAHGTAIAQADTAGRFHIHSRLSDLGHEFAHFLDMALSWDLGLVAPSGLPQMLSATPDEGPVPTAWRQAYGSLEHASRQRPDSWFAYMDTLAATRTTQGLPTDNIDYFRSAHERLAYAFGAHLAERLPAGAVLAHPANLEEDLPSRQETATQAPAWATLFEQLRRQWWARVHPAIAPPPATPSTRAPPALTRVAARR